MRQIDEHGTPPPPAPPGTTPDTPRPRPALSWLALGATLITVILLARTLLAYPLMSLRLPLGGASGTPTLVTTQQDSGVPGLTLQSIVMVSQAEGWATGWRSIQDGSGGVQPILLRWDGYAWTLQGTPGFGNITALAALPNGQLWVAEGDAIYYWEDGSWSLSYQEQLSPSYQPVYTTFTSLDMISPSEGWAAGYANEPNYQMSVIMHYHNGGWAPEGAPLPDAAVSTILRSLSMTPDGREGWAVGSTYTNDAEISYGLHYVNGQWTEADDGLPGGANGVSITNAGDAWAVGITSGTGPGYIAHWTGNGWQRVTSPTTNQLHAITMHSTGEGWIAGDGAATLHYVNGAWQREGLVIHGIALSGISMTAPDEGWADGGGVMLREHNGVWSVYTLSL